jgi:hypothetical protein
MQDAHPEYIASMAESDRAIRRRQRRLMVVLFCILPIAGLVAVAISLLRHSNG